MLPVTTQVLLMIHWQIWRIIGWSCSSLFLLPSLLHDAAFSSIAWFFKSGPNLWRSAAKVKRHASAHALIMAWIPLPLIIEWIVPRNNSKPGIRLLEGLRGPKSILVGDLAILLFGIISLVVLRHVFCVFAPFLSFLRQLEDI